MVLAEIESTPGRSRASCRPGAIPAAGGPRAGERRWRQPVIDVAVVARQTQTIHGALAQQLQSSRCGPVIETVELPPLVEQSVELVSPGLRQRIALDIDRSLYELAVCRSPASCCNRCSRTWSRMRLKPHSAPTAIDGHLGRLVRRRAAGSAATRCGDACALPTMASGIRDEDLTRTLREGLLHEVARHQPGHRPALVRECMQRDRWPHPREQRAALRAARLSHCDPATATVFSATARAA